MANTALPSSPTNPLKPVPERSAVPAAPSHALWHPIPLTDIHIDGGFWGMRQSLNHEVTLPHVQEWLERMEWTTNFDHAVAGELPQKRRGREFSDSEVYKLLEGMSWEVARTGDEELEHSLRHLTARVAAAQEPDGYLNTMFGRPGQAPKYSDLEWGHELYCYGHLIQAGVARARTHGEDQLVRVALAAADHVCREFGAETDTRTCGHPEIETALVELFRVTGFKRYLRQAQLFIERRGHGHLKEIDFGPAYFQDDVPVREATVLRGHAVRALYLGSGAVDLAVETDDEELLEAVQWQVTNTLARRTYLTGGMGAHHEGESFGQDFELPSDRSYSESCAGIASVQLNHRLLLSTGKASHADAMERALYNIVATAVGSEGRSFFYTNTLHQREEGELPAADQASPRAAASSRAPWYQVSCCPTNLTRTLASLGGYMATRTAGGIQLHQYFSGTLNTVLANGEAVSLQIDTQYPFDSRVRVTVLEAPDSDWALDFRVPAWSAESVLHLPDQAPQTVRPGYARVPVSLGAGDTCELEIPVQARWTSADPRVDAVRGQVAVERGPLVMAMESLDLVRAGITSDISTVRVDLRQPLAQDEDGIRIPVTVVDNADSAWPYATGKDSGLVSEASAADPGKDPTYVSLIPYHQWANRGPSTMRVWIPKAVPTTEESAA